MNTNTVQYVARYSASQVTHKIRDEWSYSNITQARTGCGAWGPFAIEHTASGAGIEVTCQKKGCK